MVRSYLLNVILLFVCAIPLHSMVPRGVPGEPEKWFDLLTRGLIVPTIEGIGMSMVITLPMAIAHTSFKNALFHAVVEGTIVGCLRSFLGLSILCVNRLRGFDPRDYPRRPLYQWAEPTHMALAVLLAGVMLKVREICFCTSKA